MGKDLSQSVSDLVYSRSIVFWDFDGVIKDSVDVKSAAFERLFEAYGETVAQRVRAHHEANGGMSRFEKLPLYLRWAGEEVNDDQVRKFSERFSALALHGVIDAPWVPGAKEYLLSNPHRQTFVVVSATPSEELLHILGVIGLRTCFAAVYGSPLSKKDAIANTLQDRGENAKNCLMIGDARADLEAAHCHGVPFLLRRYSSNAAVFADYEGPSVEDFTQL